MADDKTTKTPEQPVTDSGPGKETPPAPPKEPEKVSVSPEPEKKTEPEVKNPQVSVYNFAEIMKEKKIRLNATEDVKEFVYGASQCDFDVDVSYNRYWEF